jgi:hypothetical protein
MAPMVSLEVHRRSPAPTDQSCHFSLGAFGLEPVPGGLFGVFRDQFLQASLGLLVFTSVFAVTAGTGSLLTSSRILMRTNASVERSALHAELSI